MDERFTELQAISLAARAKKGRMDAAAREKASALLASILADSTVDPGPSLELLEDIKAEAIAEAIRGCWPNMDAVRRNAFRRWVPTPTTERSYRRLAFLAASILESDATTALEWLGSLIPRGGKNLGKESREILSSVFFGERVLSFDTLIGGDVTNAPELLRICTVLFDIASDPTLAISAMKRAGLATAISDYLGRPHTPKDDLLISELRSKIVADAKKWPAALRDRLIPAGQEAHADPLPSPSVELIPGAEPQSQAPQESSEPMPPIVTVGPLQEELPRLEDELSNRITAMAREVDLLRRAHERIAKLVHPAEHIEVQHEIARRQLEQIQGLLRLAEDERDRAKEESTRAIQRASELATALVQMKADSESECKRLAQQISANATGRIEEFKKKLGLTLSRLVVDLPGRGIPVTAELGKVLLLQFHQFLDALRQEGIETRIGS